MTNANLRLFHVNFTNDQNFVVDDIVQYLNSFPPLGPFTYNYIQHDMTVTIVVNQSMANSAIFFSGAYNYVEIKNTNELYPAYYFVNERRFNAQSSVTLVLTLDVLNTFRLNRDYSFSSNTRILREHRNRFLPDSSGTFTPYIDPTPEGLSVEKFLQHKEPLTNDTFYLVYETKDGKIRTVLRSKNPVNVPYTSLTSNSIDVANSSIIFSPVDLDISVTLSFRYRTTEGVNDFSKTFYLYRNSDDVADVLYLTTVILPDYSFLSYQFGKKVGSVGTYSESLSFTGIENIALSVTWSKSANVSVTGKYTTGVTFSNYVIGTYTNETAQTSIVSTKTINTLIQATDVYSPNINKIVAIPYMPDLTYWHYVDFLENGFVLNQGGSVESEEKSVNLDNRNLIPKALTAQEVKNYTNDPKLFSSEFYEIKFAHDSFALTLPLDGALLGNARNITYKIFSTTTMNSRLLYKFDLDSIYQNVQRQREDFLGVLYVQRNNEMPIYTSEYLNYLQVGYNYDVKAKERDIRAAKIQTGARIVGAIASAGIGIATGNALSAISGVTGGVSQVVGAISSVNSSIEAGEDSVERKLAELERQTANIGSADDYELCEIYGGDRLILYNYQISLRNANAILRMFKLFGYKCDEFGVPDVTTRKQWNYLLCEPSFTSSSFVLTLPSNIREEFINKFRSGVTFIHNRDFNQTQSNYETFIDEV